MKNSAIALLLSIVLSMGSISAVPVFAAETPAEEAMPAAEEGIDEQKEASAEEGIDEQKEAPAEEGIDEKEEASAEEASAEEASAEEAVEADEEAGASAPDESDKTDGADTISADQPDTIEEEITDETKKEARQWGDWDIKDEYENAETIRVGEFKDVAIEFDELTDEYGEYYEYAGPQYFKFEAEYDGYYTFSAGWCNSYDSNFVLYNSELEAVKQERSWFDVPCKLEFFSRKGEVWYLEASITDDYWEPKYPYYDSYYLYLEMTAPGKTGRGDMFNLANNVKVTWQEVPGAKYYKVYRYGLTDTRESRRVPVIVTTGLVGWDKEPGLTNGHKYKYTIIASMTGKGDSSGDSRLYYTKIMYRLKTVVIRSAKNTVPGGVLVKYDKTTSGDSYVLQYSDKADMSGAKTRVVKGANTTSYMIGGLKKGKTYYISIRVRKTVDGINYYTTFGVPTKVTITK